MASDSLASITKDYGINMTEIVYVEPVPEYFSVTWMLGSRCNYDCMYCSDYYHDNTSTPHSLETMQQVWKNIYKQTKHKNLPYKISFTGGEVTVNKNFLPLVQWLRANYPEISMILFTSNGSASLNHYKKLAACVESISFSTHSEHIKEQEFFEKAFEIDKLMVRPKKSFHVNIMNEYWNTDRIPLYEQWLNDRNISYSVNLIDYSRKTRDHANIQGVFNLEQIRKS